MARSKPHNESMASVTEDAVLAVALRLAVRPARSLNNGRCIIALAGPTATDIAREMGRYAEQIRPLLRALVARGALDARRCGAAICYVASAEAKAGVA